MTPGSSILTCVSPSVALYAMTDFSSIGGPVTSSTQSHFLLLLNPNHLHACLSLGE